jgi:hypothetical protein
MNKSKGEPYLERAQWDFTQIGDSALPNATLWEYARTSEIVRKLAATWLDSSFNGKRIRDHLRPKALAKVRKCLKLNLWYSEFDESSKVPVGFWDLQKLFQFRADFPAPWASLKVEEQTKVEDKEKLFKEFEIVPLRQLIEEITSEPSALLVRRDGGWHEEPLETLLGDFGKKRRTVFDSEFGLFINWKGDDGQGLRAKFLISEFSKWVRKEIKKHPRKLGKQTHTPTYDLKCLAAYRLNQAGFTFNEAQVLIGKQPDAQELIHKDTAFGRLIPAYADPAGWSDALSHARRKLKELAFVPR